jgi:hypothetical protein
MLFMALVLSWAAAQPPRAPSSSGAIDACALLTNAEIERIATDEGARGRAPDVALRVRQFVVSIRQRGGCE